MKNTTSLKKEKIILLAALLHIMEVEPLIEFLLHEYKTRSILHDNFVK